MTCCLYACLGADDLEVIFHPRRPELHKLVGTFASLLLASTVTQYSNGAEEKALNLHELS